MTEAGRRAAVAVGLGLVVLAAFWPAVFGGRVLFDRDIHLVWLPRVESMVRAVAEGAWPLWDPYAAFGLPALADPSYQIAYPPTWLNLVMGPAAYYSMYAIGHCFFAGAGMLVLLRRRGLSALAAFVGGAAFCACGVALAFVSVLHHFAGLAWIPWVLAALDRALCRRTAASAVVLGSAAGGQVLAGSGDMCLMAAILGIGHASSVCMATGVRWSSAARLAAGAVLAGSVAAVLSAVQWLPTASNMAEGTRLTVGTPTNAYWSVHPLALLDTVVPRLVEGFPMNEAWRIRLFEGREAFLVSLYLGVPLLLLAALGGLLDGPRLRLYSAVGVVFFALAALGRHTPLFSALQLVPPAGMLRYPVKYMISAAFLVAILAALGTAAWGRSWSAAERRRAVFAAVAALAFAAGAITAAELVQEGSAGIGSHALPSADLSPVVAKLRTAALGAFAAAALVLLRARYGQRIPSTAMAAVVVADLLAQAPRVNSFAPPGLFTHRPPVLASLGAGPSGDRLYVAPTPAAGLAASMAWGPPGWEPEWRWALGLQEMLLPPSGARWSVPGSFDGDLTGLAPVGLSAWTSALIDVPDPLAMRILALGNVGHVIHVRERAYRGLPVAAEFQSVFADPVRVSRTPAHVPRVYVVGAWREAGDLDAANVLMAPGFDLWREAVLPEGSGVRSEPPGFAGAAREVWRRADAVAIETEASHDGLLVLVDGHHPGWTATVDRHPAAIVRANTLFRAVAVPAGRHVVEFRYRPPAAIAGLAVTLSGLLAAVAAGLWWHCDKVWRRSQ